MIETDLFTQEQAEELWEALYSHGAHMGREILDFCERYGYNIGDEKVLDDVASIVYSVADEEWS